MAGLARTVAPGREGPAGAGHWEHVALKSTKGENQDERPCG
jgi:hypothetical protein